jgi:hypothetical protein
MPRKLIWAVAWLTMICVVVAPPTYVYFMMTDPVVEGDMSPEADSWGIPLFGDLIVGVLLAIGVYRLTQRLMQHYARPGLFVWRGDRKSVLITLLAVVVGVLPGLTVAYDYLHSAPSYEWVMLPLVILGAVWVAMMRALAITRDERQETVPDAERP